MGEEPETALAALFQMRGRDRITESDFVFDASMKLRWFTPKDAQRLLQIGIDRGLLRASAEDVRATFDVGGVAVPVNYRFPKKTHAVSCGNRQSCSIAEFATCRYCGSSM